ncbi:glycosyltransferase N-terminal domain-containing protein [uncultured Muribaculum sp.]|jgi:3-deoxy-D-manno-octulosonic-acid transferase|uniref:3-deoxy-D-manno-octulosonic acid transferase n=1 Tax=uncultured Muribaculum sp. TaxID=1918613 RepID=UPI00259CECE8|nr:glycosyltransferase N-terminal domain-containing protein [uncultured Muribaculum sp.]
MTPFYDFAIHLYSLGVKIASLRHEKARKIIDGQAVTMQRLKKELSPEGGYIWIHAASLGEFEQGRPLIEMIRRNHPDAKILLTFFSPSGYEVRHNFPLVDAVVYLPFDTKKNVRQFLDTVKPRMAIFVKYEFWGNYLNELKLRGIPTYIISAIFRKSQPFFKPWGGEFRKMLTYFTHIYVQDEGSRELLAGIGFKNVTVAGDTRFDRVTDIMESCVEIPQAAALTRDASLTIVAGSTWPPDESYLLPCFNAHPGMKLIIAPHEVNEERIAAIESQLNRPSCRLSTATPEEAAKCDCIIVDCYGKLSSAYRYGNIAYIGGGFGVGIHNLNEAAVYDIPVIFGPHYHKFKEARDLIKCKGGFSFSNKEEFDAIIEPIVNDKKLREQYGKNAGNYIKENLGATRIIYADIVGR